MEVNVEAKFRSAYVPAKIAPYSRFGDRSLETLRGTVIFGAQENVADLGFDRIARNDHAFDQLMRIAFHKHSILKRTRFHFVRADDQILGLRGGFSHWDKTPLLSGLKARAAAPPKIGLCHHSLNI